MIFYKLSVLRLLSLLFPQNRKLIKYHFNSLKTESAQCRSDIYKLSVLRL